MKKCRNFIRATAVALVFTGASFSASALDGAQLYQTKVCLACHGMDARTPTMPIYPRIAGQNADYAYNQMRDIKSGAWANGQSIAMKGIMAAISDEEMRAIANWLSTQ